MDSTAQLVPLGTNTFRGALLEGPLGATCNLTRTQLYSKNAGEVRVDHSHGLVRTHSPISGGLLISPSSRSTHGCRDPVTGTMLRFHGSQAAVTTPVQRQQLKHTAKFYLTNDIDITVQTLRNTLGVSCATNEKIGTAGTPTGTHR